MSLYSFLGAIEFGLIYSLVALGVFISFRLLRFPDLTVDGSFTLGGATSAVLIINGYDPFLATAAGAGAGFIAGLVTAILNVTFKIMDLLASILVMTALYSINLRVMGSANIPIISDPTFFTEFQTPAEIGEIWVKPFIMLLVVFVSKMLMDWFFSTEIGLAIRATGTNARMARAQGISTNCMMVLGLAISNAFVGLAGSLFAQSQGGADASMGIGTIVIGLAAVIVGERIIPARRIFWTTLAVIAGAIMYRIFIALALEADSIGFKAQDLNLISAILVTLFLVFPLIKGKILPRKFKAQVEKSRKMNTKKEEK